MSNSMTIGGVADMITQQLSGNWVMRNRKDTQIIPATVPGSVYGDLPKAGQMEDPFWKDNEIGIPADGERHTAGLLDPQDRSSYDNDGSHQRSVGRALCNLCKRGKHLCDEMGLVVWQDFMFACAVYDLTPEFEENITAVMYIIGM